MKKKFITLYKGVGGDISLLDILKNKKYGLSSFTKNLETAKDYAIEYALDLETTGFVYKIKAPISTFKYTHGPDEYIFIGDPKQIKIIKKIRVW